MSAFPIGLVAGLSLGLEPRAFAARAGRGGASSAAAGQTLADTAALAALFLFRGVLLEIPVAAVPLVAGVALLLLGWALMNAPGVATSPADRGERLTVHGGFLLSVRSPRWHLFWWGVGPALVTVLPAGSLVGAASFAVGAAAARAIVCGFLFGRRTRRDPESPFVDRTYGILAPLAGLSLALAGLVEVSIGLDGLGARAALERIAAAVFGYEG